MKASDVRVPRCEGSWRFAGRRVPGGSPGILSEANLKKFYDTIDQAGNLQHQIMLRLLFYTAVRVSELTSIRVEDVDMAACKIFIELGKGSKDRCNCPLNAARRSRLE
jgi:site-specific recombinase XerD